jgi:EpsI family protein
VTRDFTYFLVAVTVLVGAGAMLILPARGASTAAPDGPDLRPPRVEGWAADPGAPGEVLPPDSAARTHLLATYRQADSTLWLAVGYYPDARDGRRPAAQDLLFPPHGWSDLAARRDTVALGDGRPSIATNVLVMRTQQRRRVIMYWYQIGELNIASDHWYRTRLLWNRLLGTRADSALVRLASEVPASSDADAVLGIQKRFVARLYPALLLELSR